MFVSLIKTAALGDSRTCILSSHWVTQQPEKLSLYIDLHFLGARMFKQIMIYYQNAGLPECGSKNASSLAEWSNPAN